MKNILSILLCAAMLLSIAGCSGGGDDTTADVVTEPQTTEAETTAEITEAPETETETEEVTTAPTFTDPSEEVLNTPAATQFTVSRVFGNDMVIQRNEYIRVWGFADEDQNGKRVNAEFAGLIGAALIEDGKFMITLNGSLPECTEPRPFRVYGDGVEYTFNDVLVGDVYWMVGQSNATYPVQSIKNEPLSSSAGRSVGISDNDLIRLHRSTSDDPAGLTVGTADVNEDTPIKRGWQKPTKGALLFSALGYFTAKQLYDRLEGKIPIGMIEFASGGAALNAFCPNEICDQLKIDKFDSAKGVYTAPSVNNHPTRFMYNHYMYAFQKYPICGIIWYQGESDCTSQNDKKYPARFDALITEYRNRHDLINHDYPVFIIEFPAIWQSFPFETIRQYMGTIPNVTKNTHLCQSSDLWKDTKYENSLHPYVKWEQSVRMTNIILANVYGIGDPAYVEGPSAVSIEYSDDKQSAVITFRNVGDGLRIEGDELKGFIANGSTKAKMTAEIIDKDKVRVTYTKSIKSVSYNAGLQDTFPETITLCNSEGVPCNSFIIK